MQVHQHVLKADIAPGASMSAAPLLQEASHGTSTGQTVNVGIIPGLLCEGPVG